MWMQWVQVPVSNSIVQLAGLTTGCNATALSTAQTVPQQFDAVKDKYRYEKEGKKERAVEREFDVIAQRGVRRVFGLYRYLQFRPGRSRVFHGYLDRAINERAINFLVYRVSFEVVPFQQGNNRKRNTPDDAEMGGSAVWL